MTPIPSAGEAVPKPRPTIADLENPIANAIRFNSILTDLLDTALSRDSSDYTKLPDTYHLTRDQVENIIFLSVMAEAEALSINKMWVEIIR